MDIIALVRYMHVKLHWEVSNVILLDEEEQCYIMKVTLQSKKECGLLVNPLSSTLFPINATLATWIDDNMLY